MSLHGTFLIWNSFFSIFGFTETTSLIQTHLEKYVSTERIEMIESTLVSQAHFSPTKSTLQGVVYAMWSPLLKASTGNWPRKFFNLKKMNRLSSVEWVSEWKLACSNLSWPQSRQCSTTTAFQILKKKINFLGQRVTMAGWEYLRVSCLAWSAPFLTPYKTEVPHIL